MENLKAYSQNLDFPDDIAPVVNISYDGSKEKAWEKAGEKEGLIIWRVEKFEIKPWPLENYGKFYSGDSYIVLFCKKKSHDSEELKMDAHMWIGKYSTQDEYGTAAYKLVELDNFLKDIPVLHREIQNYESELFLSYFATIEILRGGVETGFKSVEKEAFEPRLYKVEKLASDKTCKVTELEIHARSINSSDVFILDCGEIIYQFNGVNCSSFEKFKGARECERLRKGRKDNKIKSFEETEDCTEFWNIVGDKACISTAVQEKDQQFSCLFKLSDSSGTLEFTQIATGNSIKLSLFDTNDVFLLNTLNKIWIWVGKNASKQEKKKIMPFANQYAKQSSNPLASITCLTEGNEDSFFSKHLF